MFEKTYATRPLGLSPLILQIVQNIYIVKNCRIWEALIRTTAEHDVMASFCVAASSKLPHMTIPIDRGRLNKGEGQL